MVSIFGFCVRPHNQKSDVRRRFFECCRRNNLRDGVRGNFMPVSVEILDLTIIGPFVRNVKGGRDRTPVRIDVSRFKQVAV